MDITLLDGRIVDTANIFFDDSDYSFKLGGTAENITTLIRASDKQTFPGFDQTKYNDIVYVQHYFQLHGTYPPDIGSTSVWANFVQQIATNPLQAPLDSLNAGISQITGADAFKKILIAGLIGFGLLLLVKSE